MKYNYLKLIFNALMILCATNVFSQNLGMTCDDAIPVSEGIYTTTELLEGNGASNLCFEQGGQNAVWYLYTASESGTVTISSEIDPNTTDTRLSIYQGPCDDLTCIASDDDGGVSFTSTVDVVVEAGESVYVEWDDRWTPASFVFSIGTTVEVIPGCTDPDAINYNPEANVENGTCVYDIDCDENTVLIEFIGGSFVGEIAWTITDSEGQFYAEGGYWGNQNGEVQLVCLPDGCYSFNMYDAFGDGWNGAVAVLSIDGDPIAEGTLEDGSAGNITFGVNVEECEDIVLEIFGCTDSEALNYNLSATVDDGSCIYPFTCDTGVEAQLYVCIFGNGEDVGYTLGGSDGNILFDQAGFQDMEVLYMDVCLEEGVCYTSTMFNTDGPFGWYGGYYWINVNGVTISTGALQEGEQEAELIFSIDGTCGEVYGCTDPEAENYNPDATVDNGTCEYFIANDNCDGATPLQEGSIVINNQGATSEGLYGECWGFGNGEPEQNGIWYSFTTPADPALIIIEASDDGTYSFSDTQFGLYEVCGGEMIDCDGNSGNGLYSRFEFECGSLAPSTEYLVLIDGWAGDQGTCLLTYSVIPECNEIAGCTDPIALNYNPSATIDDGSCVYPFECDDNALVLDFELGSWQNEVSWYITSVFGDAVIYAEGGVNNGDPLEICLPDGCYQLIMLDTFGDGWNGNVLSIYDATSVILEATLEEGEYGVAFFSVNAECEDEIFGCTDPNALNYNPSATIDNGTCEYDNFCDSNYGEFFLFNDQNSFGAWSLSNDQGEVFYSGEFFEPGEDFFEVCLPDGCYQFCVYGDLVPVSGFVEFYVGDMGYYWDFQAQDCLSFSVNAECDGNEILGCTDPEAINFNPNANIDDGSCLYLPGDCQASFEILYVDEEEDVMYILNTSTVDWGIEYLWDFGDGSTSTAPLPIHTYEEDGEYTICLTITGPNDCEDTYCMDIFYEGSGFTGSGDGQGANSGGFTINVVEEGANGIDEVDSVIEGLNLFPNPTNDMINLQFNLDLNSKVVINIYDLTGSIVAQLEQNHGYGFNQIGISVEDLSSGLYILEIAADNDVERLRFNVLK